MGSGSNRTRFPLGRHLQVPPRPRPGSGLFLDPGTSAGRGTPPDRQAAGSSTLLRRSGRRRSSRSSISSIAASALITSDEERRAARRVESDRGASAPRLYGLRLGPQSISTPARRCFRRAVGSATIASCSRSGTAPGRVRVPDRRYWRRRGASDHAFDRARQSARQISPPSPACAIDSVHDARSERPRGRSLPRILPTSRHRMVGASDRGGSSRANTSATWSLLGEPSRSRTLVDLPLMSDPDCPRDPSTS